MSLGLVTSGNFADEATAWVEFDSIVDRCGAFTVYKEVDGEFVHPRPLTHVKKDDTEFVRIDRILCPKPAAIDAGWIAGAFGVEGKRSGMKIGPLLTQAIDYSRCVFRLQNSKKILLAMVMLKWVFIYPAETVVGDLDSLMANFRIGMCVPIMGGLTFKCNATNGIVIKCDGRIEAKDLPMGNKRGSR